MKSTTAIVLIVILLIIVGLIAIRQLMTPEGEPAPTETNLWKGEIAEIKGIKIDPADSPPIHLVKTDEKWRIVSPIQTDSEQYRANQLSDTIKNLTLERRFAPGEKDAPGEDLTGLDLPGWKLTITDQSDKEHVLNVGHPLPLSGGRKTYVGTATDNYTYVVGVNLTEELGRPLREYRSKTVLDLDEQRIVKIALTARENLLLEKRGGLWWIVQPVSTAADNAEVEKLIGKFAHLTVDEFVDDDPETYRPYGLTEGTERLLVRVWTEGEQTSTEPASAPATAPVYPLQESTLVLGTETEEKRYARLTEQPGVFLVRKDLLDEMQATLADLRDKRVISIDKDAVLRVELDVPSGQSELIRKDDVWYMTRPFEGLANPPAVDRLLSKFGELKAESMYDDIESLGRFGLDTPTATITIHQAGKSDKMVLMVGSQSPSGEMTFLKRAASDTVAAVKTAEVKGLLADPASYWDAQLIRLPAAAKARSLKIKRGDGEFELQSEEGAWRMTSPLLSPTDAENVEKLLNALKDLKAAEIVSLGPEAPKEYTQAKESAELELTVLIPRPSPTTLESQPTTRPPDKTEKHHLRVVKLHGRTYAWVPPRDPLAVGLCRTGLWETINTELRDRTIWKIDPEEIEQIKLVAGSDTLQLIRDAESWKYTADPYVKIAPSKVEDFLSSIREIRAEKFAAHGKADLKRFALTDPWYTFTLVGTDDKPHQIIVSRKGSDKTANRYAQASGVTGIPIISSETAAKMAVKLDDFKE